jgi:hypothetical protein
MFLVLGSVILKTVGGILLLVFLFGFAFAWLFRR